jgi:hypothetical protein
VNVVVQAVRYPATRVQVLAELAVVVTPAVRSQLVASSANGASPPQFLRTLTAQPSIALSANACPLPNCGFTLKAICPLVYKWVGEST